MPTIKLKANNGNYARVVNDNGQNGLWADGNATNAVELECFVAGGFPDCTAPKTINFTTVYNSQTMHISLNGNTVVLDNSTASPVLEDRQFVLEWQDIGKVALKANNGQYVSQETDGSLRMKASRTCIGDWEIFTVEEV